jgi:hypothetical protein
MIGDDVGALNPFTQALTKFQSPRALRDALGFDCSWSVGLHCEETSGSLVAAWGAPLIWAPTSTPTYRNNGPRIGSHAVERRLSRRRADVRSDHGRRV